MGSGSIPKYADGTDSGLLSYTNSSKFSGTIYYRRVGNLVTVQGNNLKLASTLSGGSFETLGSNVLAAFPPVNQVNVPAGNSARFGQLRISASSSSPGTIYFFTDSESWGTSANIHFALCYMTA